MSDALKLGGALALGAGLLSACAGTGISDSLASPQLSPITNPALTANAGAKVSMPLPALRPETTAPNSLWRAGARSFFGDQRATEIGDILTVNIAISDSAQVNNTTSRSRSGSEDAGVSAFFGLETQLSGILPNEASVDPAVGFNSKSSSNGTGKVNRAETIRLTVAAVITDILPNGNLVIGGRQEVKVNAEVRELLVSGVIRPQDIAADNTIDHDQIAEARISYGGRGDLTSLQRNRYGTRAWEKVAPF